jgi:hypothetical protein
LTCLKHDIEKLIGKWRRSADSLAMSHPAWSSHFFDSALELERMLDANNRTGSDTERENGAAAT